MFDLVKMHIAYRARPQDPAQPDGPWRVEARRADGTVVELTRPEGLDEEVAKAMAAGPAIVQRVYDVFENEEPQDGEHLADVLSEALLVGGHWAAEPGVVKPEDWAAFGPDRQALRTADELLKLEPERKP